MKPIFFEIVVICFALGFFLLYYGRKEVKKGKVVSL